MKNKYISPVSEQVNLVAENMIATSLEINDGSADQWSIERGGWQSEDWSELEDSEEL